MGRSRGAPRPCRGSAPEPRPLINECSQTSRNSAALAASLLVTNLVGAAQAFSLVFIVGESARTDAFLAAYSLYLPLVLWAASLRSSVVPVIGAPESEAAFRGCAERVVSNVLGLGGLLSLAFLAAAPVAGRGLTADLSSEATEITLISVLILAPGIGLHFGAASLSAAFAGAGRFAASAVSYAAGSLLGLACAVTLLALFGVVGAPVGLLIGAIAIFLAHLARARGLDLRLQPRIAWLTTPERSIAFRLLAGAALLVAQQVNLAICIAALPADTGTITVYTYGFFLISLMLNVSFSPLGFALMPNLVADVATSGVAAAERQLARVAAHAFFILAPLIACFVAFGRPLLSAVMGPFMSERSVDLLFEVGLVFSFMAVPYGLFLIGGTIVLALRRWTSAAAVAGASVAIQALIAVALWNQGAVTIAAGHAVGLAITAAVLLAAIFGRGWWRLALHALRSALPAAGLALVFLPFGVLVGEDSPFWVTAVGVGAAAALYAGLALALSANVRRAVQGLLAR